MKTTQNVVKLVQGGSEPVTGVVRIGGKRVILPVNQMSTIQGRDMLFTPDMLHLPPEGVSLTEVLVCIPQRRIAYIPVSMTNTTDHTIYLDRHIGHLETVKTVYSVGSQAGENNQKETLSQIPPANARVERPKEWDPPVDLSHLPEEQQKVTRAMLREECEAFARDRDDIGYIPSLKMHITLHNTSPVQKTYMSPS